MVLLVYGYRARYVIFWVPLFPPRSSWLIGRCLVQATSLLRDIIAKKLAPKIVKTNKQ